MDMIEYQCCRCFHYFEDSAGQVSCPNCYFVYVRNMEALVVYEPPIKETEFGTKE